MLCRAGRYSWRSGAREGLMNRTDTLLRLKRFRVDEMKRRISTIDAIRANLDRQLSTLDKELAPEKQRASYSDMGGLALPSFRRSIDTRRQNRRNPLKETDRE